MFEKLQLSAEELEAACMKWGMKINFYKYKVITSSEKCIVLDDEELKTGRVLLLGSIVYREICESTQSWLW